MLLSLLIIVALLLLVLLIPINLQVHFVDKNMAQNHINVRWLFGLICVRITLDKLPFTARKRVPEESAYPQTIRAVKKHLSSLSTVANSDAWTSVKKYGGKLWNAIQFRKMHLSLRLGLDDPADTGMLWGFVGPIAGYLSNHDDANICLVPVFTEETFEFRGRGYVQFIPLQVLSIILMFFISIRTWNLLSYSNIRASQ